jgi:hypothetical protein
VFSASVVITIGDCNLGTCGVREEGSVKGVRDGNRPTVCSVSSKYIDKTVTHSMHTHCRVSTECFGSPSSCGSLLLPHL